VSRFETEFLLVRLAFRAGFFAQHRNWRVAQGFLVGHAAEISPCHNRIIGICAVPGL
jgi:hypothetical protein